MKRKLIAGLLIGLSLILSGCGGQNNDESFQGLILPSENYTFYETDSFIFQYPRDWEVKNADQVDTLFSDTIKAVFTSNLRDQFFTPTITVERIPVEEVAGSSTFADQMIRRNEAVLIDYEETERLTVPTRVGDTAVTTTLVRFEAKEKLQDNITEFIQLYLYKGEMGYIITGAYDPTSDLSESDKIVNSLQTFRLK